MCYANLKILSKQECDVYIDGEMRTVVYPDSIEKILLKKGEYWVELVLSSNPVYKFGQIINIEQYDQIICHNFLTHIKDQDIIFDNENKCYRNVKLGIDVTPHKYDSGLPFIDGSAKVNDKGKWGCINLMGEQVVPCEYLDEGLRFRLIELELQNCEEDDLGCYRDGRCRVGISENGGKHNLKYGYLDLQGRCVIPYKYSDCADFHEGVAAVSINGKWGYIDRFGNQVTPCIYDRCSSFSEGYGCVKQDGRYGFVDTSGAIRIPCVYDYCSDFYEGLATVTLDGKKGYIDKSGKLVLKSIYGIYEECLSFSDGMASVQLNGKWGCINKDGKCTIPCVYDRPLDFYDGYADATRKGKGICVNRLGEIVFKHDFYFFYRADKGRFLVTKGCKAWLIDDLGKEIHAFKYELNGEFNEGLVSAWYNDRMGFVDMEGKVVVPFIYEFCGFFSEGYADVAINHKWGIVDKSGREVVPCICENFTLFSERRAFVRKDNVWYLLVNERSNIIYENMRLSI